MGWGTFFKKCILLLSYTTCMCMFRYMKNAINFYNWIACETFNMSMHEMKNSMHFYIQKAWVGENFGNVKFIVY